MHFPSIPLFSNQTLKEYRGDIRSFWSDSPWTAGVVALGMHTDIAYQKWFSCIIHRERIRIYIFLLLSRKITIDFTKICFKV